MQVIATYLHCLSEGDNLVHRDNLSDKTLLGYVNAATDWLWVHFAVDVPMYNRMSNAAQPKLHPFFAEILGQRRTWRIPRPKKEPFTAAMFDVLCRDLEMRVRYDAIGHLDIDAAVFDWTRLGIFTGSRLSEYAQGKVPSGQLFATIPKNKAAGKWGGQPIAFLREDFTFYNKGRCQLQSVEIMEREAQEVHIRFRYDKSKENFTIRKFSRVHGHYLCPVKAAISIRRRADDLHVPASHPVGVYRVDAAEGYRFLRDLNIIKVMKYACVQAYP
ncbi:MAG: hypothetical protein ACRDL7_04130, partial [Gaiellaceae bacterium]